MKEDGRVKERIRARSVEREDSLDGFRTCLEQFRLLKTDLRAIGQSILPLTGHSRPWCD